MIFANGNYLFLLFVIPILIGFYIWFFRWLKSSLALFNHPQQAKKLFNGFNIKLNSLKFFLCLCAVTLLIFAIANPQFKQHQIKPFSQGKNNFIFAIDVSNSMLVEDILPNRLEMSKKILHQIVNASNGYSIGLVIFASKAYTYLPITDDLNAINRAIDELDVSLVDRQGTSFREALLVAASSFVDDQANMKTICIISDGESHLNDFKIIADSIRKTGTKLMSIVVGTPLGGEIPIVGSNQVRKQKRNAKGDVIISKASTAGLKIIVGSKKNIFTVTEDAFPAVEFLEISNKQSDDEPAVVNGLYQSLLWIALVLLLINILVFPLRNWIKAYFNKKGMA